LSPEFLTAVTAYLPVADVPLRNYSLTHSLT